MGDPLDGAPRRLLVRDGRFTPELRHSVAFFVLGEVALTGHRLRIERAHSEGVFAIGWGRAPETRVTLTEVAVLGTKRAPCAELPASSPWSCLAQSGQHPVGGTGVAATEGARIGLDGFRIAGSELAGMLVASGGLVSARRGIITENALGVNVMDPDYDPSTLQADVEIHGNGADVARLVVPVPEVGVLLGTR
jgi:hypothetical protein